MTLNINPGEIIYNRRKELGITQEALAGTRCSASTVSRIENIVQVPTLRTFCRLMEVLGEPGYTYGYYYNGFTLEELYLKSELLELMENETMENYDEILHRFSLAMEYNSRDEEQFFEFMKMLYWLFIDPHTVDLLDEALRIMRITDQSFELVENAKRRALNHIQILIINAMAIGLIEQKRVTEAIPILLSLVDLTKDARHILPQYLKNKAAILNNLSCAILELGCPGVAFECSKAAINIAYRYQGGGGYFLTKLIRTRYECVRQMNKNGLEREDYSRLHYYFKDLPTDMRHGRSFRDFLAEKKTLIIF